jgi:hypothetical protein
MWTGVFARNEGVAFRPPPGAHAANGGLLLRSQARRMNYANKYVVERGHEGVPLDRFGAVLRQQHGRAQQLPAALLRRRHPWRTETHRANSRG